MIPALTEAERRRQFFSHVADQAETLRGEVASWVRDNHVPMAQTAAVAYLTYLLRQARSDAQSVAESDAVAHQEADQRAAERKQTVVQTVKLFGGGV